LGAAALARGDPSAEPVEQASAPAAIGDQQQRRKESNCGQNRFDPVMMT